MLEANPSAATQPYEEDHQRLLRAVRAAGDYVRQRALAGDADRWAKEDRSVVTDVDLAANAILYRVLVEERVAEGHRVPYGWLSEESADDPGRLAAERTWIVDPIDGTTAFVEGRPHFTICVGLCAGEEMVAAAIYNPMTDEMFEATKGGGARCNGVPLKATVQQTLQGSRMLARRRMFSHPGWPRPWPTMHISYRSSTAYRMALVARGDYDAALALIPKADWDVAHGALIAAEAGAVVTDHKGEPFGFNAPVPEQRALVCAAAPLYPSILERVSHLPGDLRRLIK